MNFKALYNHIGNYWKDGNSELRVKVINWAPCPTILVVHPETDIRVSYTLTRVVVEIPSIKKELMFVINTYASPMTPVIGPLGERAKDGDYFETVSDEVLHAESISYHMEDEVPMDLIDAIFPLFE